VRQLENEKIMSTRTYLILALLASALGACGGGYGSGGGGITEPPPDGRTVVGTSSQVFNPGSLTVNAGDVVKFDFRGVAHNVFFDAQPGAPTNIEGQNANVTIQRTFTTTGTYHFTCHIHPSMRGTVVVQ
jgi:plastocyanin